MTDERPADAKTPSGEDTRGRRRRVVRLLRASVGVCSALALLYAVGVNVFLSTSIFAKVVNAKPDVIDIHYEHAWSLVPWKIHAHKLSIRGRDGNVEWILRLDEVQFRVSFVALAKMRFEATHVRGRGVSFRLRARLAAAPSSPDEVAGLPPIEGLPPYSIRPPNKPSAAEWSDAYYNLWSVHLEDVVADDTREVWIGHARFEGSARIDGRFFLKPMRAVDVGPVRVAVARGVVATIRGPIAEGLDGSVFDGTLTRFDPRTVGGSDLLARVSLECDAHAVLPDLGRLPALPGGVAVRGAAEVRRAVLHVEGGVLENGSQLEASATPLALTRAEYGATGSLTLKADVAREAGKRQDRLTFRAEASDVSALRSEQGVRSTAAIFHTARVDATGDASALDLAHPLADLHVVVEIVQGDLPNARVLSAYIPANTALAIEGGRAQATGRLEGWLAQKRAAGSAVLRAEDLDLRVGKIRVRGQTSVFAQFSSYRFDTRRLDDATVALAVANGTIASDAAPQVPLVRVNGLRLDARGHDVDLADPLDALDVAIAVPAGDIVAPGFLHAYLPKGPDMRLVSGHARFSLQGKLVLSNHLARGTLDIESRRMRVDYGKLRLDADLGVRARVHEWHWESGALALDQASVAVHHVTITKSGSSDDDAKPGVSLDRIDVSAKSSHFAIGDPLDSISMSASLAGAKVHDAAALGALVPDKTALALESKEGVFDAEVRVDVERHVARGRVRARALHMGVRGKTLHLRGDVRLFAHVARWDFRRGTMSLMDSGVTFTRVEGGFHAESGPEFSAARVALEARTSGFDPQMPTLRGGAFHLVVEEASLPDARALAALLPQGSHVRIESGSARASADLVINDELRTAGGRVNVALVNGALRLKDTRISGDFHIDAGLRGFSPENDVLALSDARLEMRNVAVTGASATTSAWCGDLALSRATLRIAPALQVDGLVSVDARDARPLLAVLFGSDLPKILVRITDVPRLVGSARLTMAANQFAILDLDAGGGDVALRGSYAAIGRRRRGGVIATKSFLSVGLRLDDDGTHLRLFGLDGWMRDQRRAVMKLLEASAGRVERPRERRVSSRTTPAAVRPSRGHRRRAACPPCEWHASPPPR